MPAHASRNLARSFAINIRDRCPVRLWHRAKFELVRLPSQISGCSAPISSSSSGEGPLGLKPSSGIQHEMPPEASITEYGLRTLVERHFDAFGDIRCWISDSRYAPMALADRR